MPKEIPAYPQFGVQHRHLERGFGHRVALDRGQGGTNEMSGRVGQTKEARQQVLPDDTAGPVDVLGRVHRLGQGDTFTPPFCVGADDPHQQDVAIEFGPERRLEGGDQIQPDAAKLHLFDLHSSSSSSLWVRR